MYYFAKGMCLNVSFGKVFQMANLKVDKKKPNELPFFPVLKVVGKVYSQTILADISRCVI